MFRFTIRDVLWLAVVVAIGLGWYLRDRAWNRYHARFVEFWLREVDTANRWLRELHAQVVALKESQKASPHI